MNLPFKLSSRHSLRHLNSLACAAAIAWATLMPCPLLAATETDAPATNVPASATETATGEAPGTATTAPNAEPFAVDVGRRLTEIDDQLEQRQKELNDFKKSIAGIKLDDLSTDQKAKLDRLQSNVGQLQASFEQIALGGLTIEAVKTEPEKAYDWQAELMEVVRPVLASLKELTDKPRRIEAIRQRIAQLDKQIKTTDEALASLNRLRESVIDRDVRTQLNAMADSWQERKGSIADQRDVARYQLAAMLEDKRSNVEIIEQSVREFFSGRGLTLGIAILATIGAWLFVRLIVWIIRRLRPKSTRKTRRRRERAIHYTSRLITGTLMVMAVLGVFYLRSDVFLLAVMILAIASLLIGLRHLIPRFYDEIRLLLDFGAVRDTERLIYEGLPVQVKEMNSHAILINPALKGFIRLPLSALTSMVSRPPANEPWFPSHAGDFVKLSDGSFAQVVEQSVDTVVLRQTGALRNMRAADFYADSPINLSQEGFSSAVTFGIGYRHQAICLTEVAPKMQAALEQAVAEADWAEHCNGVSVEFKEAATNSLDFLILLRCAGEAAGSYFAIPRLVQRTLVRVCNENDWEIPFAQLTVHQAPAEQ